MTRLAIHHLAVRVTELARAEAFYSGLLGFPVWQRWYEDDGTPRSLWVRLGGNAFLAIERATEPPASGGESGWHCVAFGIAREERETWRTRLVKAGFPVKKESPYSIYVLDPDGNLVALSHFPHPA